MLMGAMAGKTFTDNVWQDAQINRTGWFGEYHFGKSDFNTIFSGRLEYNSAKPNNPDENFSSQYSDLKSDLLTLSLSVGSTKKLSNKTSLGLWLGRAQRSPGLAERYINFFPIGLDPYEMLGNSQLKPEINNQVDLIFQYVTTNANLNIDLFASFLQDYISSKIEPDLTPRLSTSPGVRRFENIDKARISGFEIAWNQVISQMLKHDLSIVYTYGIDNKLDEPLPEIPPMEIKYSLTGNLLQNRLHPEVIFRRAFKQDRIAVSYGETKTPAFNVVDMKIVWLANKTVTLTGGIHNVFDTAYYEHLARSVRGTNVRPIYSPGRSYYITLSIKFL
jgi:iron complex outermembrane receptor protein